MMFTIRSLLTGLALTCTVSILQAAPKKPTPHESLPPTLSWLRNVEAAQMLGAILSGTPPNSGDMGWFHPGQSQYSLKWLLQRMDKDHDGTVSKQEFTGSELWFTRLDRDHDGRLTPADFDWSDEAPINRQMRIVNLIFARLDGDHNERLSMTEWQAAFWKARANSKEPPEMPMDGGSALDPNKETLTRAELHALLFPPSPPPAPPKKKKESGPPFPVVLLRGLIEGDIGSFHEGPALGKPAPDFTLPRYDGDKAITLSQFRGKKPVVLIFGSFT